MSKACFFYLILVISHSGHLSTFWNICVWICHMLNIIPKKSLKEQNNLIFLLWMLICFCVTNEILLFQAVLLCGM